MKLIRNNAIWMPKHATWLRPVFKAQAVDGGMDS